MRKYSRVGNKVAVLKRLTVNRSVHFVPFKSSRSVLSVERASSQAWIHARTHARTRRQLFDLILSSTLPSLRALQHPQHSDHAGEAKADHRHQHHEQDARQADVYIGDDDVNQAELLVRDGARGKGTRGYEGRASVDRGYKRAWCQECTRHCAQLPPQNIVPPQHSAIFVKRPRHRVG